MKKIIFNEQEIQNIITLYNQGNTLKAIGENFNVSRGVIKRILVEQNTSLRQMTPKYQANYNVFETINSSEKAYKPYNILKLLYNSCETHLDRKYLIYKNLETVVFNRNIK